MRKKGFTLIRYIRGGANILCTDGEVGFVRYGSNSRVWYVESPAVGSYHFTRWSIAGGQG